MDSTLTPDRRDTRFHAERVACLALALCAGKSPEVIAAEIASRVIHSLRSKAQPEGSAPR